MGNLKRKEREQGIRQTMTKRQTGGMKKTKLKEKRHRRTEEMKGKPEHFKQLVPCAVIINGASLFSCVCL